MRSWLVRVVCVILISIAGVPAMAAGRVALVFGDSAYRAVPVLPNPARDAAAIARLLEANHFTVDLITDATADQMRKALRDFAVKSANADIAVFYFAGHGMEVNGDNLLVPVDAQMRTDLDAEDETVSVDRVLRAVSQTRGLRLIILDACRDNPFVSTMKRFSASRSVSRGLQRIDSAPPDTLIAFSTEAGSVASDGDGDHSPFTAALLQKIAIPGLDVQMALREVRDDVMEATDGRQRPYQSGSLGGKVQALVPGVTTPGTSSDDGDFRFAVAIDTRDAWQAFLRLHPAGPNADRARARLAAHEPAGQASLGTPTLPGAAVDSGAFPDPHEPAPLPPVPPTGGSGTLHMAVVGPMTGPNAAFGVQMRNGAQQAADDINNKGGVLGRRIVLDTGDDESDPREGVAVAERLVGDGVRYVVGHFNSGISIPASAVYAKGGVLQISPSSTNPRLTEQGLWNVFRTSGRDDNQARVAARFIERDHRGRRVAILYDKTTYGKGLADAMMANLTKDGIRPVLYEGVNAGEKDYSAVVSKVRAAGADIVYWGGLHPEGGLIRRQMTDQGIRAPMMSGDGITDNEFATIAGPSAEGTLMTFGPDPRRNPAARSVVGEFLARNIDPQAYTLYSYAAVQVMAQAAEAAHSADPRGMADMMHSGRVFQTVLGPLSFDRKGDVVQEAYVIYVWKRQPSGQITYVQNE